MTDLIGRTLRGYEFRERIGAGGYGEVYRAYQPVVNRDVAIKVILPEHTSKPEFAERFEAEARLVARLEHPYITPLYDYWRDEEGAFLVMRFIRGGTLRGLMRKSGHLSLALTVRIFDQLIEALTVAHQAGVVHRDIKPDNILLDELGNIYLTDFGIAKNPQSGIDTDNESVMGSFAYLSPEQIQSVPVTASTDVYALGVLLYELLTGEHPYEGATTAQMVLKHMQDPVPSLKAKRPELSPDIDLVIARATSKTAEARYQTAQEFGAALHKATQITPSGVMVSPVELPKTAPPSNREQRNRYNMLQNVRTFWIEGVLENSLHGAAMIELSLIQQDQAAQLITIPWDVSLRQPEAEDEPVWSTAQVVQMFDQLQGKMLILGDPGAGKTTMMLELARNLLLRAQTENKHPIPAVFNLSSWDGTAETLEAWLLAELRSKYQVPQKVAQAWIDGDELLLLLDGLDEVAPEHRESCVDAVNTYRESHGFVDIIVCSRIVDYEALSNRLDLNGALILQPLNDAQMAEYLRRLGPEGETIQGLLMQDDTLREMARSPLILSIITLAYIGTDIETIEALTGIEDRRRHLFDTYVRRMFDRRIGVQPYSREDTLRYLSWLAGHMLRRNQTVFQIEKMQPDWLGGGMQPWVWVLLVALVSGGIAAALGGGLNGLTSIVRFNAETAINNMRTFGSAVFAIVAGVALLRAMRRRIEVVDALSFSPRTALRYLPRVVAFSLFLGFLLNAMSGLSLTGQGQSGLTGAVAFLLAFGVLSGFVAEEVSTKSKPNEGIRRSARNALVVLPVLAVALVIAFGLEWWQRDPLFALFFGPTVALAFGLVFGPLNKGGEVVVHHLTLRAIMRARRNIPRNFARFLDHTTGLIFTRKVGGSYVFIHRYLLEYFAALQDEPPRRHS